MSKFQRWISVFILCSTFSAKSYALSVSVLGIEDISQLTDTNTSGTPNPLSSNSGYGGGLLIDMPIASRWTMEIGALYVTRKWDDSTLGANTVTSQVLQYPLAFYFRSLRYLSFGLGGYYESATGYLNETGATTNSKLDYATYGLKTSNYGALADIVIHIPLGTGAAIRLDGRYLYGLDNMSTVTGTTINYRDVQILAGFTFVLGGHGSSEPQAGGR